MTSARLERLLDLLEEDAADPFLAFALAKEYHKLGQPEKALEIYLELIKNHPNYTGAYYHLGQLYLELGKKTEAEGVFRDGLAVTATQGDHHAHGELQQALTILTDEEN